MTTRSAVSSPPRKPVTALQPAERALTTMPSEPSDLAFFAFDIELLSDPWRVLDQLDCRERWMAWQAPAGGASWLAWGDVDSAPAAESISEGSRHSLSREQVHARLNGSAQLPLWVGGSAFMAAPCEPLRAPWKQWPRAAWWRPRRLLLRAGNGSLLVCRGMSLAAAQALASQLRELARQPSAERATTGVATSMSSAQIEHERSRYEQLVSAACREVSTLDADRLRKLVVARQRRWLAPASSRFDVLASLQALRQQQPGATCFGLSLGGATAFIGATPETLLSRRGDTLSSHALAGTQHAQGGDLASAKIRLEQALVVQGLRRDLSPFCTDLEVAEAPVRVRAGGLEHLASSLRGRLREDYDLRELARVLHPTAALGGWPRAQALGWLRLHEGLERGWYGGPLGFVDGRGDGEVVVAIRSALLSAGAAWTYAGAGIVAGSVAREEWLETEAKLATAANALRLRRELARLGAPRAQPTEGARA